MSKSDFCLKCSQWGHTSSSCKVQVPSAEHTAEPGEQPGMHKRIDCAKGSIRLCRQFVPSITQPIRCGEFKAKGVR